MRESIESCYKLILEDLREVVAEGWGKLVIQYKK